MFSQLRVGIIGAGIGGLTTAALLRKSGFSSVRIFERSPSFLHHKGYSLGLTHSSGWRILNAIAPEYSWIKSIRLGKMIVLDHNDILLFEYESKDPNGAQEMVWIKRLDVIQGLASAIPENWVEFSKELQEFEERDDAVEVRFKDGSVHEFDVLIASDGVHSVVRSRVSEDPLKDFGITQIGGLFPGLEAPEKYKAYRQIALVALSGLSVFISVDAMHNEVLVSTSDRNDKGRNSKQEALEEMKRRLEFFKQNEFAQAVYGALSIDNVGRATRYHDRDPVEKWRTEYSRVFLLGDSLHPMTPFLGQGANCAMEDAVDLVQALSQENDLKSALQYYQNKQFQRAKRAVYGSRFNCNLFHPTNSILGFARNWLVRLLYGLYLALLFVGLRGSPRPKIH